MQHLFESTVYAARRKALAEKLGKGIILISGNGEAAKNYKGNPYRFRQDSNFLYYAGLQLADLHITINAESGETTLYGDDLTVADVVWMGPQPALAEMAERVGIGHVRPLSALVEDIHKHDILCLPPYRTEHYRLLQKITDHCDCSIAPSNALIRAVVGQREIKEDIEIVQMEEAVAITAQMHIKVMQSARPGSVESSLAGIAQGIATAGGGGLAYGIILSKHGHILHNTSHSNTLQEGDLVLGDFGAENAMCYAGDITRTFPAGKKFTSRQRDIYDIVLDAEMKCINALRPGQLYQDVHLLAARIIADGLTAHGLMKGNPEDAVEAGAHALFFPHGLGHQIGLDVHDMEGLGEDFVGYDDQVKRSSQFGTAYLRMGKALKAGHVLTVEPGLYFIPALIDKWRADGMHTDFINYDALEPYRDFGGVRIEDDVLVTDTGHRVLGPPIPKSVEAVEGLKQ